MRRRHSLFAALIVAFATSAAQAGDIHVVVGLRGDPEVIARLGGRVRYAVGSDAFAATVPAEAIAALRMSRQVAYVEVDQIVVMSLAVDDPRSPEQWGLAKIQAPYAWDASSGGVTIAICDTGVDESHPDLVGKETASVDWTTDTSAMRHYHGTHVAGIATASTNNALGVAGTAPGALILDERVLDSTGAGYDSWVANGMRDGAARGARVINASLGGRFSSTTGQRGVDDAWAAGAVVCCAAGNSGNSTKTYPGAYANSIAVAASTETDALASFSNRNGRRDAWVDVAAPGTSILSTLPVSPNYTKPSKYDGSGYGKLSGTSMSTPFVSGIAALVWTSPYQADNVAVRRQIEANCDGILLSYTAWGRVNALRAVTVQK